MCNIRVIRARLVKSRGQPALPDRYTALPACHACRNVATRRQAQPKRMQ